jgi:tetratricopeptide (TPR) repeat protein
MRGIPNGGIHVDAEVAKIVNVEHIEGRATFVLSTGERRTVPFLAPAKPPFGLVGRADLMRRLKTELRAGECLALKGIPGVGKTTVAIELAHDPEMLEHFNGGVLWAGWDVKATEPGSDREVTDYRAEELAILGRWLRALDVSSSELAGMSSIEERQDKVRAAIGMRRVLFVIDDAWSAEQVLDLKLGGPNCGYVITTRNIEVVVDSDFKLVEVTELQEQDGLHLLEEIAPEAVLEEPAKARELVKAVGGLPLALTLIGRYLRRQAAGGQRSRLARALDDLLKAENFLNLCGPYQVSLSAAIMTSYTKLEDHCRRALRMLSIFPPKPNTFSLDAACCVSQSPHEVIYRIVDTGLLESSGNDRYTMHKTIADFAGDKLKPRTDELEQANRRMAEFFVQFIKENETNYDTLQVDVINTLSSLRITSERHLSTLQVEGANALYNFLENRGLYELAEGELQRAERAATIIGAMKGQAKTYLNLGRVKEKLGMYVDAERFLTMALDLAERDGDTRCASAVLHILGVVAYNRAEDLSRAQDYLRRGFTLAEENQDLPLLCLILRRLGLVARQLGDDKGAQQHFEDGLARARSIQDNDLICTFLNELCIVALNLEDYEQAAMIAAEGLALAELIHNQERIVGFKHIQSRVACYEKDYERAEELLAPALEWARATNYRWYISLYLMEFGELYLKPDNLNLEKAAASYTEAEQLARGLGSKDLLAFALFGLARVAEGRGDRPEARRFGAESRELLSQISSRSVSLVEGWLGGLPDDDKKC